MVDVVDLADAVEQAELIADGSQNIVHQNVLGHEVVHRGLQRLVERASVRLHLFKQRKQRRHVHALAHPHGALVELAVQLRVVTGQEPGQRGEVVADDLHLVAVHHDQHAVDSGVLNGLRHFAGNAAARLHQHFAGVGMGDRLGGFLSADTRGQRQLLIELIAAHMRQIVALGIEEQGVDQAGGGFHRRRLAGTQLVVNLNQRLLPAGLETLAPVLGGIAGDGGAHALVVAQQVDDLRVGLHAHRAQKHRQGQLAGAVDAGVQHVVRVGLILDPRAAVGDHLRGIEERAGLVDGAGEVHAGGTHELRYDYALGAVDDEGAVVGHDGEIAHEDLGFLDFAGVAVGQADGYLQGRGVGLIALLAFFQRILRGVVQRVVGELQRQTLGVVRDRRHVGQNLSEVFLQKMLV